MSRGVGVWTRDQNTAFRMGRGIKDGRVWINCYHACPAHATFGGYEESGTSRDATSDFARARRSPLVDKQRSALEAI